jgi:hypothetical protein
MSNERTPCWALALAVVLAAGCGGGGREGVVPVSGRVTYDGKPVPEGRILFYPVDGRRMAIGSIDERGHYALTTFDDRDGAYPGKHIVVIDAAREVGSSPKSVAEEVGSAPPKFIRLAPEKYADRSTSGLEAEVKNQENTINFDIPK